MQTIEDIEKKKQTVDIQDLVIIKKSPRGRKLKQSIALRIPKDLSSGDKAVCKYVCDSLCWKKQELIYFTFKNKTVFKLATHLFRHATASPNTLYQYIYGVHRFFKWFKQEPDLIIQQCLKTRTVDNIIEELDKFIGDLKAQGLADNTISNYVKSVRMLFKVNGITVTLPFKISRRTRYSDRAPTQKELEKTIDLAELREKVIISIMALSGLRIGTLVHLKYKHVKKDLENGIVPIHIHIERDITKGKYQDYDTFIGLEAVEYLRAYLDSRRQGTEHLQPEKIHDESPLIRNKNSPKVKPITESGVHRLIHKLYAQAGLIDLSKKKRRYQLRAHSIRKFFRTQLGSQSTIPTDYIEYMMGHRISVYNDIRMKGIEFLRTKYVTAELTIKKKIKTDIYDVLDDILKSKGIDYNKDMLRKAIVKPHKTICEPIDLEEQRKSLIRDKFMEMIREELLQPSLKER